MKSHMGKICTDITKAAVESLAMKTRAQQAFSEATCFVVSSPELLQSDTEEKEARSRKELVPALALASSEQGGRHHSPISLAPFQMHASKRHLP